MQKFNSKFKSKFPVKVVSKNLEDTKKFAQEIIENLEQGENLILLQGNLGAGKTCFSQAVLNYLEAEGPFTSPTFVIIKDYEVDFKNKKKVRFKKVYHLDCYRISGNDLLDLGWKDIIKNKENLVLIEWPEKISEVLLKKYVKINFKVLGEGEREVEIS